MKALILSSFLVLLFIPGLTILHIPLNESTQDVATPLVELNSIRKVDVSLVGNVYLSQPGIVNGEMVEIYGKIRNNGGFQVTSYVLFTVKNSSWKQDIASQKITLTPNEEQYVKTSWMGVEGTYEISIQAKVINYRDSVPENNIITTVFKVAPEQSTSMFLRDNSDTNDHSMQEMNEDIVDISIMEKNNYYSIYEIKPGDSQVLDLTIISHDITDEFRVIVGGITNGIRVDPDQWILPLFKGEEVDLQVKISVSQDLNVGSSHTVELLLYRSSHPSDIVQKSFDFLIVSDYTQDSESNTEDQSSSSVDNSQNSPINASIHFSILSISEVNPPIIGNITHDPTYPSIFQNVTIIADIIDESTLLNATLFYSFNEGSTWLNTSMLPGALNSWSGEIITPGYEENVTYFVQAFDNFTNSASSSQYSFLFDNSPPVIGEVQIDDNTPNYQQNVTISTQINDQSPLRNVTLYYSFDNGTTFIPINMTGSAGTRTYVKDVLLVVSTSGQYTDYLSRNLFTWDSITASTFSSITISTLSQYRILILEPNWVSYTYLRNGLLTVNQALDDFSLVVSIRVAGNQGSQADIDFLGTDYDRSITHIVETIVDSNHPFISGAPWSGSPIIASYFNSWSSTDHGWLYNLPASQEGYTEILQNANGISMFEYSYKGSHILLDTLTSIDGGWGSGNDFVADNYINYLNYTYYQLTPGYQATIPIAPVNTLVQYYINAIDMVNNSAISETNSYFSDGSIPQISNVTETTVVSELDSLTINATISDNWALDNTTAILVYTYDNTTFYQTSMTLISGNETYAIFQAVSPVTTQSIVFYSIQVIDLSGLQGSSGNFSYLVDHMPVLNSQLTIPTYPQANQSVTINATVSDDYGIASVILHYNSNSTWDQISMNLNQGIYQATIPATINDTNVDYFISITDTFGHQINSSNFNYHSDGLAPSFTSITHTPIQPNADAPVLVQAIITDSSGIQNASLSYSTDAGSSWTNLSMGFNLGSWEASIPALNQSIQVNYFVTAYDQADIMGESNQTIFDTDADSPQIYNLTEIGVVSELSNIPINVTLTDNFGVDSSNVLLLYSYDNSSWFSTAMSLIMGDTLNGTYNGNSPSTSQNMVYYYVQVFDLSGRSNISSILTYTIDHQPVVILDHIEPLYPSPLTDVNVYANITEDVGLNQVVLYYNYNTTWQQTPMANVSNQFTGTIGFTNMDTQVSYYVSVIDSFGHMVNSSTQLFYVDGLPPTVENISYVPTFPTYTENVTVKVDLVDNQNVYNSTLYYTTNGTWIGVNVSIPQANTVTGRDPTSGEYYGITQTMDYDSGDLKRLSIYVYSSDSDTLYVTLWGFRMDTEVWEQFHYSGSRGTGNLPEFNWATPIYDQWRIQIYDSESNDYFYYSYEYDYQPGYSTTIPATNSSSTVQFYIEAFDYAGNKGNSSLFSYFTDADAPSWSNITIVSTVSELTNVPINITIGDNVAVNTSLVIMYYSYNQLTWFSTLMTLTLGSNITGTYTGNIPATSNFVVYYYINASDISGLTNQTLTFNYTIDHVPILNEVRIDPLYPNPSSSPTIYMNITDDSSLSSVKLSYEYIGSSGTLNMTENSGLYEASIPATGIDSLVNLTFIIVDSFGHNLTNSDFSYFSDGLSPIFRTVQTIPAYPNYLQNVTVVAAFDDVNGMRNVTLYYRMNSGIWNSLIMNGTVGIDAGNPATDVLLISHGQDTSYLTRNGYTFDSITEFQFSTITTVTLSQYRILILEPDWSNYAYLRSGLVVVDQALDNSLLVVSIRVGGNAGSQTDIDFLGTDYSQTAFSNVETILESNHPFITGSPWGGNTLLDSDFNSWGYTDHGWLYNLPISQQGYTEILQNANGISMFEYSYKNSHILVDSLTSIDGGWGTGNDPVADNYINYLYYLYSIFIPSHSATIPVAPADTIVEYYIEATDLANNSAMSGLYTYLVDGGAPQINDVTQVMDTSQLDSAVINATVTDGLGVDNSSVLLIYTYNNLTYYQSPMAFISGNETFGIYQGVSPATSQSKVYYYISARDISELRSYSGNFSYRIDFLPVIQNISLTPTYPSGFNNMYVLLEVTDDIGIANATLYYTYNSTWVSIPLTQQGSDFEAIIPPLNVDAFLTYYIVVFDTFGHQITSSQDQRYIDGLIPAITDIDRSPVYPINNTSVMVSCIIKDNNTLVNKTLIYSVNGSSWISLDMNQSVLVTINGRNPPTGNFASGTTQIIDHDVGGPIERLLLYVYSADSDTISVTLWGMRIDSSTWEQFYTSSSLSNGYIPEFNWPTPIYNQWRIQMYDTEGNDYFYYSYEYDALLDFGAQIPGFGQDTNITYYIQSFDIAGNFAESNYYSYVIDGTSPTIQNVTEVNIAPAIDPIDIEVVFSDRGGINESLALLYYSFDNSSWFNTQMVKQSGTIQNGSYSGTIPASVSETTVYYYIYVEDLSGLNVTSSILTYLTLDVTINLQSPAEYSVLNGTILVDFEFLITPNTSLVELSFDQGGSWINMTNTSGDLFIHTLNTSAKSEGLLDVWLNVTVIPSVSLIRTYTYYIDRSIPQIISLTNSTRISGSGDIIYSTISDAVINANMSVTLFYTYDNSTWYQTPMVLQNQSTNLGTYSGTLPAASGELALSYYVTVTDELGWTNQSSTINTLIDYEPVISSINLSYDYVRSDIPVTVYVFASDDYGIFNVSLYYNYDDTNYSTVLTFQNGAYQGIIPSTLIDVNVTYSVGVFDTFLQYTESVTYQYYSDGIDPNISYIVQSPSNSNLLDVVTIYSNIDDKNPYRNVSLFYTFDGSTWTSVDFISAGIHTITGRNPISGTYYNETITTDYASGPLSRLSVYTYSSDADTIAVTLWGFRSDTGTWEQFYSSSILGTGYIPEFNWANIVYEQWRIEIHDTENDDSFHYSFEFDIEPDYFAEIPASSLDGDVDYYIFVSDMSNRTSLSSVLSYYTDGVYPTVSGVTDFDPVSQFVSPRVYADISDNIGLLTPRLFYSTDEITWFSQVLTLESGNMIAGRFYADIPAISSGVVAYYIEVSDLNRLISSSIVRYYVIDTQPEILFITHFPAEIPLNTRVTVTAFITDDYGISIVRLYYWINGFFHSKTMSLVNGAFQSSIDPISTNANVEYIVNAIDTIGQSRNSTSTTFMIDGLAPTITFIQVPVGNSIPHPAEVPIEVHVEDNVQLNMSGTTLYISYDRNTWIEMPMQLSGGTTFSATFIKIIPEIPTNIIYFYVVSYDDVGLMSSTSIMHYNIEIFPDADEDGVADWTEINVYNSDPNNNDTDGDGLLDFNEIYVYSTNATDSDTDNDGMPDGWEVRNSLNPRANDANLDADEDGLLNIEEYNASTNPQKPDTDDDGMPDEWEILNDLNPTLNDSYSDADNDELINLDEFFEETDPQNADSDADLIPDGWEVFNSLNPLSNDSALDPDVDELSNYEEFTHGTDPQDEDTDNDGMPDGWEVRNSLNPLVNDAELDADEDGYSNLREYELDSDPNDPNDPASSSNAILIGLLVLSSIPVAFVGIRKRDTIRNLIQKYRNRD